MKQSSMFKSVLLVEASIFIARVSLAWLATAGSIRARGVTSTDAFSHLILSPGTMNTQPSVVILLHFSEGLEDV
jgi:hypothetical protein